MRVRKVLSVCASNVTVAFAWYRQRRCWRNSEKSVA